MLDNSERKFIYFCSFTIFLLYLLILAGGVVRSTGSGMGCPDWPKCFGLWIPPTKISQLPSNFVEIYSKGGHLSVEFNVFKTWTEYINRLLGALVGIFIILTLYHAFFLRKKYPILFYSTFLAFVLVVFQGWLGAKVVSSNLSPYMISIHMVVALIILILLILSYIIGSNYKIETINISNNKKYFLLGCCLLSIIQILIGSQVRQSVDVVAKQLNYINRELWINELGIILTIHRLFAYIIVAFNLYLLSILNSNKLFVLRNILIFLIGFEVVSGFILVYFGIPYFVQPIHLLLATLIFGFQFFLSIIFARKDILNS